MRNAVKLFALQLLCHNITNMLFTSVLLLCSIAAIVLLSSRYRFSTFFVLIAVAMITGLVAGIDGPSVLQAVRSGFGTTLEKIGLLIIFGATLGALLDRSGATMSLARYMLDKTGAGHAPQAISLTGYVVGLPIFCDSGFVVLSGLALMLSRQTRGQHIRLIAGLATALFGIHCLAPPHPGISAAAGAMQVDLGKAMLAGAVLAIVPILAAWFWIRWQSKSMEWTEIDPATPAEEAPVLFEMNPRPLFALLPIAVPIVLIALRSALALFPSGPSNTLFSIIQFAGDPVAALFTGIVISLFLFEKWDKSLINGVLESAVEKSGPILAVTAAGGAFGAVINALGPGAVYGPWLSGSGLGLWAPFLLAAILKTAQGSSTVAVITTSAIIAPFLPALGLADDTGRLFALMAMGCGSMTLSHANDSYFWVVSRFGQLPVPATLRVFSTATLIMGSSGFLALWLVKYFINRSAGFFIS